MIKGNARGIEAGSSFILDEMLLGKVVAKRWCLERKKCVQPENSEFKYAGLASGTDQQRDVSMTIYSAAAGRSYPPLFTRRRSSQMPFHYMTHPGPKDHHGEECSECLLPLSILPLEL